MNGSEKYMPAVFSKQSFLFPLKKVFFLSFIPGSKQKWK